MTQNLSSQAMTFTKAPDMSDVGAMSQSVKPKKGDTEFKSVMARKLDKDRSDVDKPGREPADRKSVREESRNHTDESRQTKETPNQSAKSDTKQSAESKSESNSTTDTTKTKETTTGKQEQSDAVKAEAKDNATSEELSAAKQKAAREALAQTAIADVAAPDAKATQTTEIKVDQVLAEATKEATTASKPAELTAETTKSVEAANQSGQTTNQGIQATNITNAAAEIAQNNANSPESPVGSREASLQETSLQMDGQAVNTDPKQLNKGHKVGKKAGLEGHEVSRAAENTTLAHKNIPSVEATRVSPIKVGDLPTQNKSATQNKVQSDPVSQQNQNTNTRDDSQSLPGDTGRRSATTRMSEVSNANNLAGIESGSGTKATQSNVGTGKNGPTTKAQATLPNPLGGESWVEKNTARVQFVDPSLGAMRIAIAERGGNMVARIAGNNQAMMRALQDSLPELAIALGRTGTNLRSVTVNGVRSKTNVARGQHFGNDFQSSPNVDPRHFVHGVSGKSSGFERLL